MISISDLNNIIQDYDDQINSIKPKPRTIFKKIEKSLRYEEITVLTGARRTGKTYLLFSLYKKHKGIYLNFEDERLIDFELKDFDKIMYIAKQNKVKYLYLDEIQNIIGWEKFAHRVFKQIKIIVSGSNSALVSSDFARVLVGRTITFRIYTLNYIEFLNFRNLKPGKISFEKYLDTGGFPRIVLTGEKSLAKEYYNTIIYRDIIPRYNIKNTSALLKISNFLLSNISKEFSFRSLKHLSGLKHEITIKNYIQYLEENYLISTINNYAPSLKKQETYGKKVYASDIAFAYSIWRNTDDKGRFLENLVYNNLAQIYSKVFFFKQKREIDFIVFKKLKKQALNICYKLTSDSLTRELTSLSQAEKFRIKPLLLILYSSRIPKTSINIEYVYDFLLTELSNL